MAIAHYSLARMYQFRVFNRWGDSAAADSDMEESVSLAKEALRLDPMIADAHVLISHYNEYHRDFDSALRELKAGLRKNPRGANLYVYLARFQMFDGDPESAIGNIEKAIELAPRCPPWFLGYLGLANLMLGKPYQAIPILEESLAGAPGSVYSLAFLAAARQALWPCRYCRF